MLVNLNETGGRLSSLLCVHVEAKKMPRVAFVGIQLISVIRCTFVRPIFREQKMQRAMSPTSVLRTIKN